MSVQPRERDRPPLRAREPKAVISRWESTYRVAVVLVDLAIIAGAFAAGIALTAASIGPDMWGVVAAISTIVLLGALLIARAWNLAALGQGTAEFRCVGAAVAGSVVALGLTGLALEDGHFRPWVFVILPATGLALCAGRVVLRRVLHTRRRRGRCLLPVLVAGSAEEAGHLIDRSRKHTHQGWSVAGVCLTDGEGEQLPAEVAGVPVVGGSEDVPALARGGDYRVLAVVPDAHWTRARLRELAWQLEGAAIDFVVAPALMEFTGPRLHVAPAYGLTLLRVRQPSWSGPGRRLKFALDRLAALGALVITAPVFLAIAAAVKIEDRGPILFTQQRAGKDGAPFGVLKFRTMVIDAEQRRAALESANEATGPLFKIRDDPRITRIGAMLRRSSLDELPQLVNVLAGQMSFVGPRPPLPDEVERYAEADHRRLLVRPGLTGLCQVSGRSDLSWAETIRLELYYVDNWSLAMDAEILWKTTGAVLGGRGAY